jgi:hypothetical protein
MRLFLAASVIFGLWLAGYGPLQAQNPAIAQKEIPWDWYERADSRAVGSTISTLNMSLGETGVRCMCAGYEGTAEHTGFFVQDSGDTFVVVRAPKGYSDTVGRIFRWPMIRAVPDNTAP